MQKKPTISLCMIVKATDEEANLLDRALSFVNGYVDEMCITITGKNKACDDVCKGYGAKVTHFEWENDFAKARNFNFSQAIGEYIFWIDADDVVDNAEKLRDVVEEMKKNKVDAGVMNYLYDFNEYGDCTVKHLKTRIVKNDGCVFWVGALHEDFEKTRELTSYFVKDINILHRTTEKRAGNSSKRNLEIALSAYEKDKNDPRNVYLVANAYMGDGNHEKAKKWWLEFINVSHSEEEKYLAYLFLSDLHGEDYDNAAKFALQSIYLRPAYPNAYFQLGKLLMRNRKLDRARQFIEIGLQLPVPDMDIIVHNPRDYDFQPLMMLLDIAMDKGEYDKADKIVNELHRLFPSDREVEMKKKIFDETIGELRGIDAVIEKAEKSKDMRAFIDALPEKQRVHPKVCALYNSNFFKTESSGKDLVYYCGYTSKSWSPKSTEVGGSEEAVINLSSELAKLGWNVTVYNNCGKDFGEYDGVIYKPYWMFNVRDKNDVVIYWRHPRYLDYHEHGKAFVDMHDVIQKGEFNEERLKKVSKVFLKSNAHAKLYDIPEEKRIIVPNGIRKDFIDMPKVKKDDWLILNTSSPDRHLDATLDIFEELLKKDSRWRLAWYYGWGVYDNVHEDNQDMLNWKKKQVDRFEKLVKEGKAEGGYMLNHDGIAKMYQKAGWFLYPTQFYEIDCISARKAQIAECNVVTSDFAALDETVQFGNKVHTDGEKWGRASTFGDDSDYSKAFVPHEKPTKEWKEQFLWSNIAKTWDYEAKH